MTPAVPWPSPPFPPATTSKWSEQLKILQANAAKAKGEVWEIDTDVKIVKIDSVDMAMVCIVGKKATHKSAVIRNKIVARLKTAVSLLVTRGAAASGRTQGCDTAHLVFNEDANSPERWISPGTCITLSHRNGAP